MPYKKSMDGVPHNDNYNNKDVFRPATVGRQTLRPSAVVNARLIVATARRNHPSDDCTDTWRPLVNDFK